MIGVSIRIISFSAVSWLGAESPFVWFWIFNTNNAILIPDRAHKKRPRQGSLKYILDFCKDHWDFQSLSVPIIKSFLIFGINEHQHAKKEYEKFDPTVHGFHFCILQPEFRNTNHRRSIKVHESC